MSAAETHIGLYLGLITDMFIVVEIFLAGSAGTLSPINPSQAVGTFFGLGAAAYVTRFGWVGFSER